jgi:hypothetical protein
MILAIADLLFEVLAVAFEVRWRWSRHLCISTSTSADL